jgi:DNA-binding response OmpR family regulator
LLPDYVRRVDKLAAGRHLVGNTSARIAKGRKHNILIVEDDGLMRTFYKSLFQRLVDEFTYRLEDTGRDALLYLKENPVDVVITDWDMPGLNGIKLIKAIRSDPATKAVRVIMISGRTSAEDQILALKTGADEYLSKPIDVEVLLARLKSLLRR